MVIQQEMTLTKAEVPAAESVLLGDYRGYGVGKAFMQKREEFARSLKGVKIAIMGCIVNGPGEMADADFGYVGGAPGRVNLYVGKDCVERNIASAEAPGRLVQLIKDNNRWVEPVSA